MSFEAHVTLSFPPAAEGSVRRLADAEGLRLTSIELARGAHPLQVMLTRRLGEAEGAARSRLDSLVLAATRLPETKVVRTKLELELDDETGHHPHAVYIEHHVKVRLPASQVDTLATFADGHHAHLSRNPFRKPEPDIEERFLTQRFDPAASPLAASALDALVAGLRTGPWSLLATCRELVIHDDNRALDLGWAHERSP